MSDSLIFLIIYFIGSIPSYLIFKWDYLTSERVEWTIRDRTWCIAFSILLSWLGVVCILAKYFFDGFFPRMQKYFDKKARW